MLLYVNRSSTNRRPTTCRPTDRRATDRHSPVGQAAFGHPWFGRACMYVHIRSLVEQRSNSGHRCKLPPHTLYLFLRELWSTPTTHLLLYLLMARSAACLSENDRNAIPRERPSGPLMSLHRAMVPHEPNSEAIASKLSSKLRFPTKSFTSPGRWGVSIPLCDKLRRRGWGRGSRGQEWGAERQSCARDVRGSSSPYVCNVKVKGTGEEKKKEDGKNVLCAVCHISLGIPTHRER